MGAGRIPARSSSFPRASVMIAAGTSPNVIYEKEHPGTFKLDRWKQFFQSHSLGTGTEIIEDDEASRTRGFFTSYQHPSHREKLVTFYGDNHPQYAGNVVKAMASAKVGYPQVVSIFSDELAALDRSPQAQSERDAKWNALTAKLDDGLVARVHEVNRLTPTIVEVVVRAPFAARHFEPGQFFRLQNFETYAPNMNGTTMAMEGIALTGASADPESGLLSVIVLEMGGSSRLCALLKKDEPVVLMGPTGAPTEIPRDETILLAGGGLGNAVLFSIARALKDNGCRVVYFAGYKKAADVFKRDEIEAGTHQVIWSVDAGDPVQPRRPQDLGFTGNIVQSMLWYASESRMFDLKAATRLIAIGSDGMMRAVQRRPPRRARALPRPEARRHRLDQLADAMHDETGLRAMPPAPRRPHDRQGVVRLLLLQPGPAPRRRRLHQPPRAASAKHGSREALESLAHTSSRGVDRRSVIPSVARDLGGWGRATRASERASRHTPTQVPRSTLGMTRWFVALRILVTRVTALLPHSYTLR